MKQSPSIGDALAHSLVLALGNDCLAAAAVARSMIESNASTIGLENLCDQSAASVGRVTRDFTKRGWLTHINDAWHIGPNQMPTNLPSFLEGAAAMRLILPDDGRATAVVTMPPAPSAVESALATTGFAHAALVRTKETFEKVADSAVNRLTIMTPFLNDEGIAVVFSLFRRTQASQRYLIIRRVGGARALVAKESEEVTLLGLTVLDYTLPADDGFETFHAKVLLADQDLAYVGSANMTVFARHSMELGVLMDGKAARAVASVVRAIERVAAPVQLQNDHVRL